MIALSIVTTCSTEAEARRLGEGITCALDDARVLGTSEHRDSEGDRFVSVQITFPAEHDAHVDELLDADNRVVSWRAQPTA